MSHLVKIKARPNQPVHFPPLCVNCAQPATTQMGLHQRLGRVTRLIAVPLCQTCHYELRRRSGDEERLYKIGWLVSGILFLFALAILLILTPGTLGVGLRLLMAGFAAAILAGFVFLLFRRASRRAELPAKQAIRQSAQIANFSWRATTFEFKNETFADQFRTMNETRLMEI
ncbi:MAG: hypothetical protein H6658_05495 [Ardenticatenaceae bacterium]|nr:hypothetical protein [Ardenticatenaceae bacterium]